MEFEYVNDEVLDDQVWEHLARDEFGLVPTGSVRLLAAGNISLSAVITAGDSQYVLQDLNTSVFPDPESLMKNVILIIDRMVQANLPAMSFLRTVQGHHIADVDGSLFRCYEFLGGHAPHAITDPDDAQSTARAFGRFADAIDGLHLAEHMPGYHDFDGRIADLETCIDRDEVGRVGSAGDCVTIAQRAIDQIRLTPGYEAWLEVPVRNAHNDAKGPNCVIGETGSRTIIDLDTCMPSSIIADVGELVRSSTRAHQSSSLETVMTQIEAVNRGFLAGYRRDLTDAEQAAMLLAGPLLTTENAVRFLTDYLSGDTYYRVEHPDQNLDRAKEQLSLAQLQIDAIEHALLG